MKVILASFGFYPLIGGVENSLLNFGNIFTKNKWEVVVLTTTEGIQTKNSSLVERLFNFDVIRVNQKILFGIWLNAFFSSIFGLFLIYIKVRKYRKYFDDADIIIARDYRMLLALKIAYWRKKSAYIIPGFVSDQDNYYLNGHLVSRLVKQGIHVFQVILQFLACKMADHVFVFSEIMYKKAKLHRPDVQQIEPGVDLKRFAYDSKQRSILRQEYGVGNDSKVVLCMGRMEEQKGFINVLRSWKEVQSCDFLFFVGSGSLEKDLRMEMEYLNLSNVHFIGSTDKPEYFYSMADIFFHSSIYEPFGQTLIEAAASGISILALHEDDCVTATKEIMGEVVDYARLDYMNIASCLDRITPKRDRSGSAYKDILTKYSWDLSLNKIVVKMIGLSLS